MNDRIDAKERSRKRNKVGLISTPSPQRHPFRTYMAGNSPIPSRRTPSAINRGESYVKNLPIDELITRFKNACEMLGFQDKRDKTHPPGIFKSNAKPTR